MPPKTSLIFILLLSFTLTACQATELTAPCPNYGQSCVKKPINSWNYPN